ncbi:MAG: DUF885 domain-containing protein [Proteobacteria bacterium]|nr:DUF885 domain-containing protein [Pseudomonadota bacterium]
MIRSLLLTVAIATALTAAPALAHSERAPVPAVAPASQTLHQLFQDEWERGLRESPEIASYRGDKRYNDRWTDLSLEAIRARQAADRAALQRLRAIDGDALTAQDQLSYDVFEWQLERAVQRQKYNEWQRPLNQRGGVQNAEGIAEVLPFASAQDYRDWLARLEAVPTMVEQTTTLMREGLEAGNTPPQVLMQRVTGQIDAQIVEDPAQSPFYKPFTDMPESISASEREALRAQARAVISEHVVPAYRDFAAFFEDEYLPGSRQTIAAADLPDGAEYYDFLAGHFTTTDLTADEIHQIGLGEVARIRAEMEQVKAEVGFDGSLTEFFEHLRTAPEFFYQTPEELLEAYQAMSKRIDPELVKISRMIPRLPYGVRAIPDNIAPDTTTAYYQPGAVDGSRAGYYYVNLYKPEVRPKWEMMALSLHEAVPGHHFQFARGMELPDVPMFRRVGYFTAYGEGWGLYAERLGYDMGLYDDPFDRMGQLAYDMWRAVRLVVDTGMHAKGWTQDQAVAYMSENSSIPQAAVEAEIRRYITWPGQATSYKIGMIKIQQLRAKAEAALGEDFDIRGFHDAVLGGGAMPLTLLERRIDQWIEDEKLG